MNTCKKHILVLHAQVPFTSGGAELLIECLCKELRARDFLADVVSIPFNAEPKSSLLQQMMLWRAIELREVGTRTIDLVIATKFPTYMISHPNKVTWLIHQHRQLYDLYGSRFGDFSTEMEDEALRQLIIDAEHKSLKECKKLYTISENVSTRLETFLGLDSSALPPPLPYTGKYYSSDTRRPYILSVGRLCSIKRVDMIIRAMSQINDSLNLKIVGSADEPQIEEYLHSEVEKHHLWSRVEFLGRVPEDTLLELYSEAFLTYYAPFDEDYGFVAPEATTSGSPVVTTSDSGYVLHFIKHLENGVVVAPEDDALAKACNQLLDDQELYQSLRKNIARANGHTTEQETSCNPWDTIIDQLTETIA